jgi:glutamate-1-semialdehyde 2,1-aminomutase
MKMEGGYHGSYELAEVSLVPFPDECGSLDAPASVPVDDSFPDSVLNDTVVCPYNEPGRAEALIDAHAGDLAAVIVEPILGSMGMVPASKLFLQTLRRTTERHGIVLIFDEVISLRLGSGGIQSVHGIIPDLTCMGKIIGGGLPVGGVGGKRALMQHFSPERKRPVMHASTFSGNALTMAAGRASMQAYDASEVERINRLGQRLRDGFNKAFSQSAISGQAIGQGSLTNLHLTDAPINDSRDALSAMTDSGRIAQLLHLSMLRHGVMSASRLMYCVSTAMSEVEVDQAIAALHDSLAKLEPFVEEEQPALMD